MEELPHDMEHGIHERPQRQSSNGCASGCRRIEQRKVLNHPNVFNDVLNKKVSALSFYAINWRYNMGCYLVVGIYPR